ncbi:MAG TPA: hypothetical protein VKQ72_01655 [Aggregatilineales bacterium]|nr:hypothetical protein [Aggregatilineales bacterium]
MRTSIFTKLRRALAALAVASVLFGAAPGTAQASGTCPAPGTGLPGALNMVADGTMLTIPMAHDAAQGNAGMSIAVGNSGC